MISISIPRMDISSSMIRQRVKDKTIDILVLEMLVNILERKDSMNTKEAKRTYRK